MNGLVMRVSQSNGSIVNCKCVFAECTYRVDDECEKFVCLIGAMRTSTSEPVLVLYLFLIFFDEISYIKN